MNLHEFQAKQLMRQYKISVPTGGVASSPQEALAVANELGGSAWVVKAQVHAGGRGKAGGVKIVKTKEEVEAAAKEMLGTNLVTYQTDANGQPVQQVLVEAPCNIKQELYLGAVIDRATQRIVFMSSTEGGVEIEEVANTNPEKIIKTIVDPQIGLQAYQCREAFFSLNLPRSCMREFCKIMLGLYDMFHSNDLSLLEVNPLVLTAEDQLLCLDGKINIDDNALYRHEALREMRDPSQEDERERRAQQWDLSYIALDGNIGCMVNGAGLAMATMDLIKLNGGEPANFLDVGGSATEERVTEAFKIIVSDDSVKAILVNIFGGIVRCDLIAEGIIKAVNEVGVQVPVVVRLEGNKANEGAQLLADSGLNITAAVGFADAAEKVVAAVGGE